jgi:hypothetical protein
LSSKKEVVFDWVLLTAGSVGNKKEATKWGQNITSLKNN